MMSDVLKEQKRIHQSLKEAAKRANQLADKKAAHYII
jgi:hypothetical protein